MKKIIQTLTVVVSMIPCLLVSAGEVRQVSWKDLVPGHLTSKDLMANLNQEQRDIAIWVINMLEQLPDRGPDTEQYYQQVDEAMPTLKKAGIDIADIMAKRKEIQTAVVKELNDQNIRIAGYLLPLEASAGKMPLKIAKAYADFSQPGFPVANAIDGKPATGWAVAGHEKKGQSRTAVFAFDKPLAGGPGTMLTIRLRHESQYRQHNIGRFRISLTTAAKPSLMRCTSAGFGRTRR